MLRRDVHSIRAQMRSDFEAVMTGLAVQRDAMKGAVDELRDAVNRLSDRLNDGLSKQEGILLEHMQHTEARFSEILDVVVAEQTRTDALEARVTALEQRLAG